LKKRSVFVEFKRLYEQVREKLPTGFATIGHALRNEISPRQGPIRLREFTIIDLEFFIDPAHPECPLLSEVEDETLPLLLIKDRKKGVETPVKLTVKEALARGYVKMEWQVSGFNYRTDYDLKGHMQESGVDLRVYKTSKEKIVKTKVLIKPVHAKIGPAFKEEAPKVIELLLKANPEDVETALNEQGFFMAGKYKVLPEHVEVIHKQTEEAGRRFLPHVIEPSFGSDRLAYVALEYAYTTKDGRIVLELPRDIAPVQLAVLPLVSKDGLPQKAKQLHSLLIDEGFTVEYDESGSIGRRYARFDEIGTPLCITVDYQSLEDETVTIRDRTTWKQVRAELKNLPDSLHRYFQHKLDFEDLGVPV